jgi:hypothetical protein
MVHRNHFHNRNSRRPTLLVETEPKPVQPQKCDRLERFAQFLKNRGCPVKLVYRETETDIRWIG